MTAAPAIRTEGLTVTYPGGDRAAIQNVNFSVEQGEIFGYPFAGLSPIALPALAAIALVASLTAPLLALVLAAASPNKVAGFAVVKVLNAVNLLPIAAFFVPVPLHYVAGVLPTYWPMRALWSVTTGAPSWPFLAVGTLVGAAAVVLAARVFQRRLMTS